MSEASKDMTREEHMKDGLIEGLRLATNLLQYHYDDEFFDKGEAFHEALELVKVLAAALWEGAQP